MSTLTQPITGLSANDPVPGTYLEVAFAQGEIAGDPNTPKVLLIGPKLASGSATANTQVYLLTGVEDAKDKGGAGTPVHRMARRFAEVCKSAQLYAVFTADSTGGTTAGNTITLAGGTASATGVITYTLAGEKIQVGVPKGTTITAAATDLKEEINLQTHWPVTAVSTAGVVTVTSKCKGTDQNAIRQRAEISNGITMTATVGNATLTGGTSADSYTAALATIEPDKYDYIVPFVNPTSTSDTRVAALKTQIVAQALPTVGIRQQAIICHGGTQSVAGTFVANSPANHARMQCLWQEKPEWEPAEVAAHFAAVRYNKEVPNPVYNYDFYGKRVNDIWNVPKQYASSDWPTRTEISAAISAGLSPIAVNNGSRTYVVRSCTCSTDVRVRDTSKVTTADRFAADLGARYESQWASANLQDDPADSNVQVAANVLTPARLKALTIVPLYIRYANDGWLDSDKTFDSTNGDIVACTTGIDGTNPTRVNARVPLHVTKHAHQFAALISENSAA